MGYPVDLATRIAGEDISADVLVVDQAGKPIVITGNTAATLIKSGAGAIRNLKILAGTAVITVWDNTAASGTTLLPAITNPAAGMELLRDVRFTTGLTITVASSSGLVLVGSYR